MITAEAFYEPELQFTEAEIVRDLCRVSYEDFVREFWGTITKEPLLWNWHMTLICREIQEQVERVEKGLPRDHDNVCNICPGSSKSTLYSVLPTPWVWTRMPHAQFICASYAYPLALDLSNKSRDVVKSEKYRACYPEIVLRPDQDTKGFFKNTAGGYRYAVGSGGSVLGMHGHFITIDDPLDPNKALSEAEMKQTNHWIKHSLRGRKVDKRVTVTNLVMQRLHQNDPTAQMLRQKRVTHFCLPAELSYPVKPPALAVNYVDGLMDPVRIPREVLEEERAPDALGEYGYASQYGQSPIPEGGGMFKTSLIRPGRRPPVFTRQVRYWDKAATEAGGAFSVGVLMAEDLDKKIWILDVVRKQWDSATREKIIRSTARRDGPDVIIGVEQEGAGSGKESAQGTVRRLRGFRVRVESPKGRKEIRADEFSVYVNGGWVRIPDDFWNPAIDPKDTKADGWVGWAAVYIEELAHFPFSTFKDQVDASSGGFKLLIAGKRRVGGLRSRAARRADAVGDGLEEVNEPNEEIKRRVRALTLGSR